MHCCSKTGHFLEAACRLYGSYLSKGYERPIIDEYSTSSFGEVGTNTTFDSDRVALGRALLDAMSQAQLYHGPVIMHLGR